MPSKGYFFIEYGHQTALAFPITCTEYGTALQMKESSPASGASV